MEAVGPVCGHGRENIIVAMTYYNQKVLYAKLAAVHSTAC